MTLFRNKFFLIRVIFIALIFFSAKPALASVTISEVAWMGTAESQFGEWIELYNDSTTPYSLDGVNLYEQGGSALISALVGTIPAGGFFVIERTTPSVLDPLTSISDFSGAWGGGGLSNSGEYLVLKDKTGALLDSLNASSGWPAGDNSTKETMQKYNGVFVTATGTPKLAYVPPVVLVAPDVKSEGSSSSSVGGGNSATFSAQESALVPLKSETEKPWHMSIGRDRIILPGTPIELSATFEKIQGASYFFKWNFGDGTIGEGIKVTKIFEYPGTYAVVVNGSAGEMQGVDRISIEVADPEIEIATIKNGVDGFLEIKNGSKREVNLGRFRIASAEKSFTLPPDTILLPKTAVKFSNTILGIKDYGTTSLVRPDGKLLTEKMSTEATSTREKLLAEIEKKILDLSRQLASLISSFK